MIDYNAILAELTQQELRLQRSAEAIGVELANLRKEKKTIEGLARERNAATNTFAAIPSAMTAEKAARTVLAASTEPLKVAEITSRAEALGWTTTSSYKPSSISQALTRMQHRGEVEKLHGKWQLRVRRTPQHAVEYHAKHEELETV